MNPYDFVPLVGNPDHVRCAPDTHECYADGTFTGRLICRLTTLTPLFIYNEGNVYKNQSNHKWARSMTTLSGKTPIIPGSSLKGVIRSVAEAVSSSCFSFCQKEQLTYKEYRGRKLYHHNYDLPSGFEKCKEREHLCPSCRLFGMIGSGDGNVFMGKVAIGDAMPEQFKWGEEVTLAVLSAPKVRHRAFYQGKGTQIAGRKFYFHSTEVQKRSKQDNQNKTIIPIIEGAVFTFSVDVVNLSADELELLLYALVLEEDMTHKIGMGKPVGLGSVKIEITHLQESNMRARYQGWNGSGATIYQGQELGQLITEKTRRFRESTDDNLEKLREIWKWPPQSDITYCYPSKKKWFDIPGNKNKSISETRDAPCQN